ncbi:hypothetical protein CNEO4_560048 [Clostridium neonatale]|nr:hypothetical protein CNEO4_560048 [Clostridium neonatale]
MISPVFMRITRFLCYFFNKNCIKNIVVVMIEKKGLTELLIRGVLIIRE